MRKTVVFSVRADAEGLICEKEDRVMPDEMKRPAEEALLIGVCRALQHPRDFRAGVLEADENGRATREWREKYPGA